MKALTQESLGILSRVWEKAAQVEALAKENGFRTIVSASFTTEEWAYFVFFLQTEDQKDITKVSEWANPKNIDMMLAGLDAIAALCVRDKKEARILALENELAKLKGE